MSEPLKDYLAQLEVKLRFLPEKQRIGHINEVKDDLVSTAEELMEQESCSKEEAERQAVASFLPSQELGKQIVDQYNREFDLNYKGGNVGFQLALGFLLGALSLMSLPIYYGEVAENIATLMISNLVKFLIAGAVIVGFFWFKFDPLRYKVLRYTKVFMLILLVLPLGSYILHIIRFSGISTFSTLYLFGYLVVYLLIYLLLRRMYKKALVDSALN
ncbi:MULTISPECIES: hypothetical protein [Bacillaceae]|uniref:DUF1129 domain-containing protein n=1 Tax=Evansella alkalicola TaxID=745819 RepID=A0ABS6JXT3_9BACI|nr:MULTISPECIES: hypothetical protein [Bacillaceae]MBU9723392.1 hypothetical protein [Bacillus alkalicola]